MILERAWFNCRCQREGGSAEQYITALYSFIETCEYGAVRDEMLRDRIVVGIRDAGLSERLQLDPELMLEKAKKDPIVLDEVRHANEERSRTTSFKRKPGNCKATKTAVQTMWSRAPPS